MKNRAHNIRPEMIGILLFLKIKDVNLDQEKENQMKQKKVMSHKQNILKLSKKERKVYIYFIFIYVAEVGKICQNKIGIVDPLSAKFSSICKQQLCKQF